MKAEKWVNDTFGQLERDLGVEAEAFGTNVHQPIELDMKQPTDQLNSRVVLMMEALVRHRQRSASTNSTGHSAAK